jgi:ABC-type polysaccharide/polyol phosphate export permease
MVTNFQEKIINKNTSHLVKNKKILKKEVFNKSLVISQDGLMNDFIIYTKNIAYC